MLKQTVCVFAILWGSEAAAQTTAPQPPAAQPGRTCALPSIADQVALNPVPGSDLMTVPVEINGKPKQFLLDIGTGPTEVSQATVSELGLPRHMQGGETIMTGSMFAKGGGGGFADNFDQGQQIAGRVVEVGSASAADVRREPIYVGTFTMGDATGHNMQFVLARDADMGKSKPYDGLMTASFFNKYDVDLDFGARKLTFLTPTGCTDADQVVVWPHAAVAVIPMTILNGKIQVEVNAQGHAIPAVIDTSSPRTVMRRDIAESIFGLKADTPDMMPDGDHRDGLGQQIYRHTFSQISFPGGVTAFNVPALIQTNSMVRDLNRTPVLGMRATFIADPRQRLPSLTLGMDVLHQLHIYIVPGQQTLYVTAAATEAAQPATPQPAADPPG